MTKATKIIIAASIVIALLIAAIGVLIALNIQKSPERNQVGTVLDTKRRSFVTNYYPVGVGSSCPYRAYSLSGDSLDMAVDHDSLLDAIKNEGFKVSTSTDGFVEGAEFVEVDAETESIVHECGAVAPGASPRKTTILKITKLYNIKPASTFPRH